MNEGELILKNSSKYELYNKFNQNIVDTSKYDNYCQGEKYLERWYSNILDVCYKFARNLINLHEILKEETKDERCRYLNFCITDYIRKKSEIEWSDKAHINDILRGIFSVENVIRGESKNYNCYFDYKSNVSLDIWKERKDLHDYIRNYNDIKEKIMYDVQMCTKYSKYFEYIKGLHEKYKGDCCNNTFHSCPNNINLDYFCSNDTIFDKLECNKSEVIAAAPTGDGTSLSMDIKEDLTLHSGFYSPLEHNNQSNIDVITNNSDYYAKLGVSLSFLGILSTFFYLYNFTTFGNWIHSKVQKHKINIHLDEDAQALIAQELNDENENTDTSAYNITYYLS
ncbi:PIR Superfamily Protein [Plasmodium ovale wallikeri]|uniref:PIR Superfamily Protein n=1 Tax=Plasmodium ovale wallikeri TaxID=864142 RepID=A0A1A9AM81_PLAOA|nr:PIR Superfamily Protein [Plasmodium ovale wallikeri]SBT57745.1 PIR Superfamily Protein [Plasmodium ovale wallikeri]